MAKSEKMTEEKMPEVKLPKFSKEQVLSSVKYSKNKDLLSVLLKDDVLYTEPGIDEIIEKFMKGKVK